MKYGLLADRLRRSAAIGALLTATSAVAWAQQEPPAPPPQVIQTTPSPQADETPEAADRITVTGSRIQTDTYSSSSAMTVVTTEEADEQGITDIATLLQNSVAAAGSSQTTAAISAAIEAPPGGLGTQTLQLRGLGATRTLVLLNGRRAGPAGTGGSVGPFDLNVIPLSMVERVEILKDGASSIYGSDAIAGVINLITKRDSSSSIDFSYTAPQIGAGEELAISGTWGQDFGNGYFRVSGDYFKQKEYDRGDNSWFDCGERYIFNPDGSRADTVDPTTGRYTCSDDVIWGHNWTYDYGDANRDDDGNPAPAPDGYFHRPWQDTIGLYQYDFSGKLGSFLPNFGNPGVPVATSGLVAPAGWFPVGYGQVLTDGFDADPIWGPSARDSEGAISYFHPFQNDVTLSPEIERMSIVANGEYDINDHLTVYGEALLNRRSTFQDGFSQVYTFRELRRVGAGPVTGDQMAIAAGWTLRPDSTGDGYRVFLSPTAMTDHADESVQVDYTRFVAGAKGDLPFLSNWTYDASVQFSRSEGHYKEDIFWADAVADYEGQTDFCAGELTRYRGAPCVDVEWYAPRVMNGQFTAAEKAFLEGVTIGRTVYEQGTFEAYATGPLFALPAGDLSAVIGVMAQHDRIDDHPDQPWLDGEVWQGGTKLRGITRGTDDTRAAYAEFSIPVVKDLPFVKALDLSLSGRYTDVESYGGDSTYKVGFSWAVNDQFRLRASQGTSFRTPGLFELYLSQEISSFALSGDPCADWDNALADGQITQRMADNCQADPKFPGGIGPDQLSTGGIEATVYTNGGLGSLTAETSDAKSLGFIWEPTFADLQFSVDYYEIEVNGQVGRVSEAFILRECYDSPNFPNEPFCNLFTRNGPGTNNPGTLDEITNNYLNIASQTARGIDFEARYGVEIPWGALDFSLKAALALEAGTQLQPGSRFNDDVGEPGDPEWVAQLNTSYTNGPWSAFWGVRYTDATSVWEDFTEANPEPTTFLGDPVEYKLSTPPKFYHSLSVGYEFENIGTSAQIGVRNLFDEEPPKASQVPSSYYLRQGNSVLESAYDIYGRTFFVNVSKKF